MDITKCVSRGNILNRADLQTTFRQGLGAIIWVHQTRPGVGFSITKIATDLAESCDDSSDAIQLCRLYSKTVRFLKAHVREMHYFHHPKMNRHESVRGELGKYRVVFSEEPGFATMQGSRSIESDVIAFAKVLYRDGSNHCRGYLIDRMCAQIRRVCRPSLSDECHAAVTAWG